VSQLSFLPEPSERVLVADGSGRIVYVPEFIERERAAAWFEAVRTGADWRAEKRPMYDRIVDVPRLVASYALDDIAAPAPIAEAGKLVSEFCNVRFTRAGLNLYRDRNDSVAPHGDHTEELDPSAPVALLSLGAARLMTLRSTAKPVRALDLDLEPGSLLVMDYPSQLGWQHGIPKSRRAVGPRVSIAFRRGPRLR
jgi:alkylated DNA repair dioxygenase AlkB